MIKGQNDGGVMGSPNVITRLLLVVLLLPHAGVEAVASVHPATVIQGNDERVLLISGNDRDGVEAAVNAVAARGYRLLALSLAARVTGLDRLECLLMRPRNDDRATRSYRFVQAISFKKTGKLIDDLGGQGYRVLPWGVAWRSGDYIAGQWNALLIVMERPASPGVHRYQLVVSTSRQKLLRRITSNCESGFDVVALQGLWGGQLGVIMEREASAGAPLDLSGCGAGNFEIVKDVGLSLASRPLFKLVEPLQEMSSRGYRLLAATSYVYSGANGAMLFEKAEQTEGRWEYLVLGMAADDPAGISGLREAGAEGYRLHPRCGWLPIVERRTGDQQEFEYLVVGPEDGASVLDAVATAVDDGFRVVGFCGDEQVLLEREAAEP